jgi:hypothetical protein
LCAADGKQSTRQQPLQASTRLSRPERTTNHDRRIFVGDIQGCREPLERLLAAVAFVPGRDRLLPVGDLVNKGPDSKGAGLLMQLRAEPVLGNHDLHWLGKGKGEPAQREWLRPSRWCACSTTW